jgi:hypothetical protein
MNKQFNVSEIKCNGIGPSLVSEKNHAALLEYVTNYRLTMQFENIVEKLEGPVYYGSRCEDDSTIAVRMFTGLTEYALDQFDGNRELAGMWLNASLNKITKEETNTLFRDALRDCAESDHWYKFEKDWN